MLRQPVVQLDTRAMGHAKVGDDYLISVGIRAAQLLERDPAVFRLIGIPPAPA